METKRKPRSSAITPLRVAIHLGALLPLGWIIYLYFGNQLTINPIQDLEQRTGRLAILWVVLSLSATPLVRILSWKEMNIRRRTMGLYAFLYAFIHFSIFVWLDYGFQWKFIFNELFNRWFILVGAIALLLLTMLAATSFKWWQRTLKKNWKRIHRAVYLIAPLVVLHYALALKGNIFTLQGNIFKPLIYAGLVTLLLILRIPPVRKFLTDFFKPLVTFFQSIPGKLKKKEPHEV